MLVELRVVEQRYPAVMEVVSGDVPVVEVAQRYGVSRKTVHTWLGHYRKEGLAGLADRSHRPHHYPDQLAAEVEARVCELHRAHPRWAHVGWLMSCADWEPIHCRRGRRSIGCWSATAWSPRSRPQPPNHQPPVLHPLPRSTRPGYSTPCPSASSPRILARVHKWSPYPRSLDRQRSHHTGYENPLT